jgi:uncharacterized protein
VFSVVADTNFYISAFAFGGTPERFLRIAEAGGFRLFVSEAILTEVAKMLRSDKFLWPEDELARAQRQITRIAKPVQPAETLHVLTADPPDNRILECAPAAQADYIVSGDKHLLNLKQHGKARILKVAEFMKQLEAE